MVSATLVGLIPTKPLNPVVRGVRHHGRTLNRNYCETPPAVLSDVWMRSAEMRVGRPDWVSFHPEHGRVGHAFRRFDVGWTRKERGRPRGFELPCRKFSARIAQLELNGVRRPLCLKILHRLMDIGLHNDFRPGADIGRSLDDKSLSDNKWLLKSLLASRVEFPFSRGIENGLVE